MVEVVDQGVAGAAGNRNVDDGNGWRVGARSSVAGKQPRGLAERKDHGRNGQQGDGGSCAAALGPAVEHIGGAAVGGEDGLDWAVKDQRRAVVVAGCVYIVGALRLKEAPEWSVLRLAVHGGLGPGGGPAGIGERLRGGQLARIVGVVRVLHEGQGHGAAGVDADAVDAGKAERITTQPVGLVDNGKDVRRSGWPRRRNYRCG